MCSIAPRREVRHEWGAYLFSDAYSGEIHVIDTPYAHATFAPFAVTNTFEHPDETSAGTLPRFRTIPDVSAPSRGVFRLRGGDLIFEDGFESS